MKISKSFAKCSLQASNWHRWISRGFNVSRVVIYHVRQKLYSFILAIALSKLHLLQFLAHIYFNKFPITHLCSIFFI